MSTRKTLKEFEKIYKDTYNTTLKYLICKCYNLDDINDIIQETYMELYRNLKQNKKIKDKRAFILGIANNKLKKYINSKAKIQTVSLFQKNDDKEITIDIDSRNRYWGKLYKQA